MRRTSISIAFLLGLFLVSLASAKSDPPPTYVAHYDVNDDLLINIEDIMLVASSWGAEAVPTDPDVPVEVMSNYTTRFYDPGTLWIFGEVVNGLDQSLTTVKVTANIYNAADELVGQDYGYVDTAVLPPGERTCFAILVYPNAPSDWDHFMFFTSYQQGDLPIPNITILDHGISGGSTSRTVIGTARNDDEYPIQSARVVTTLYDDLGHVVDCDSGYIEIADRDSGLFQVGEVAPFDTFFYWRGDSMEGPFTYRLQPTGEVQVPGLASPEVPIGKQLDQQKKEEYFRLHQPTDGEGG